MADSIVNGLELMGADVVILHAQDGFTEVGEKIDQHVIKVSGYKIVILMLGRADLWETDKTFREAVAATLGAIRKRNEFAIIIFTAIIPGPNDTPAMKKTAGFRHGYLSYLAAQSRRLEFSRPGKHLLFNGTTIPDFYNSLGEVNERGLDQISRAIMAKIRCAGVFCTFHELVGQ